MSAFLSPVFGAGAQFFNNQGIVLSGGKLYTYIAGTTAPTATWTDSTQAVANANPIILDSAGRLSQEVWLAQGTAYKFILKDANDNTIGTWDNISGVNDVSTTPPTQWTATGLTPSYLSSTSFSVAGDYRSTFTANRRVQAVVSAGTIYGYVTDSQFSTPNTIVTIQPDSTVLDAGLSSVSVGMLTSTNPSVPQQYLPQNAPVTVASAATTPIGAATSANVIVSGNVTITAFDTVLAGILRFVKFTGTPTLTYNGTSMILPGGVNIVVAAGADAIFRSLGSGNWECISYQVAALSPGAAATATNASTATALQTARTIDGVSFDGTANIHLPVLQNSQSANYTTVASDENKQIYHPATDNNARTYTIDSNANVPYEIGSTITFINEINTITIAITSDTLVWSPLGTTGSRTLAANGIATAVKVTSTRWYISGSGLT